MFKYNNLQIHDKEIKTIFEVILIPPDTELLSLRKPFSNKKAVKDVIKSCEKYILGR
ncbi:MAG: hypothetical protein QMD06_01435 [Candidatus Altarchaeum sp.]|nr:hypothetical protein [Candidatus Altarchaeum sp.]